jgi:hypothetical protein
MTGIGSHGTASRALVAALILLAGAGCQPRPSDPDPGADDPPPAPVAASDDTLTNGAPAAGDTAALAGGVRHPSDRQTGAGTGTPEIERLYREAYSIARAGGCSASGDCAAMPVGSKPCGGPWEYVVYCRLTTDTTRLRTVLDELARRQREYNAASQMGSTCDMILEPPLTLRGGRCAVSSP